MIHRFPCLRFGLVLAGLLMYASATVATAAEEDVKRLLYVTSPDGAGGSRNPPGLYVYDIDDDHKLVKHVSIPDMGGTRGCCGSAQAAKLFISHRNTHLMCFDLLTEKKVWEVMYPKEEGGADRCCVTPDGKKVYVPAGWWSGNEDWKVVDGSTGKLLKNIKMPHRGGHNTIMSPSGKRAYWGSINFGTMAVVDTATDQIVHTVTGFSGRVSPYCINGAETLCFVNCKGVAFEVGDIRTGKMLHRVEVRPNNFSHGVGLRPDEKEVWLSDPAEKKLWIYDATVMPPKLKTPIDVSFTSHGWITFSIAGDYAYPDTGDVIDPETKKIIHKLVDAGGNSVRSSKFIEIHFRRGKPVAIGEQFGIGRVTK